MGASRIRVTGPRLRTWEEVDERLRRIGLIDLEKEGIEAELHRAVARLKDEAARKVAPLDAERENLVRDVKEFVEAHRAEMEPARSRVLNFGTVGFRQSTRLVVRRVAETLKRLRDLGLTACIRVKEEVDKEALREYGDEILAQVGVTRKVEDAFYIDLDRERVRSVGDLSLV